MKTPVSVDTGRLLVPTDLIERVQVVERAPGNGPQRMSDFNSFLLSLNCGCCGEAVHGYTSTKTKPSGLKYKCCKYRCAGRANNPGACHIPILSADALQQVSSMQCWRTSRLRVRAATTTSMTRSRRPIR